MSQAKFKIETDIHPHDGPRLDFEIKGLTPEQHKLVYLRFNDMFGQRFIARGVDFLNPGTYTFNSNFRSGDEAKMFLGALLELGVEFSSLTRIREDISEATKELIKMQGLQK